MSEVLTGESEQTAEGRSMGRRVGGWLGALAVLVLVLLAFLHVFAPVIASDEEPPPGHPRAACIACHLVTSAAEVDRP